MVRALFYFWFSIMVVTACAQPSKPSKAPPVERAPDERRTDTEPESQRRHRAPPPEYGHRVVKDCRDKDDPRCRYLEAE